ncbi:DUF2170 family protein [Buttiauxella massiliensis]|uniref:DUF2170 family protein n=1 Tax=Buttiauxella massiliensis TaxID=2831590 RepID=UPI00125F7C4B|nr:DUF2170 family protein [Buttiauxella massiliensis]
MPWSIASLYDALVINPNYCIVQFDSALIIRLKDYGDLQLILTLTQKQMLIETSICPVNVIARPSEFNLFLLRHQKILPLSTVGIASINKQEFYIAFGALATHSSIENINMEIDTLAENALELAELIEEFI